jgi:FkbM family methyltransferase
MQRSLRHKARRALLKVGLDVRRVQPSESAQRRAAVLATNAVTVVVDGGANEGGYGRALRESGYRGRIVSFEPLSAPFRRLCAAAQDDPGWECRQLALGDRNTILTMNVSNQNEVSSSLLPAAEARLWFDHNFVGTEQVSVVTLDSLALSDDRIALKLDLEGYEPQALDGAKATLERVRVIEIELWLLRYPPNRIVKSGGYRAMLDRLEQQGFMLVGVSPGLTDSSTGRVYQIDAILERI